jgi:hypothetical protein
MPQVSLWRWLVMDLLLLVLVVIMSLTGSLMVIVYEEVRCD